jgi:hypothetical protein
MKLVHIAYAGAKQDGETAFFQHTGGITWMPGSVHQVEASLAARMLEHPDVFRLATTEDMIAAGIAAAPAPGPAPAAPIVLTAIPADGKPTAEQIAAAQALLAAAGIADGPVPADKPAEGPAHTIAPAGVPLGHPLEGSQVTSTQQPVSGTPTGITETAAKVDAGVAVSLAPGATVAPAKAAAKTAKAK